MDITSFAFHEWTTITTISLSVIAIIISIWSSRQTAKQTHKQIESIKDLSRIQIESTIISLETELFNTEFDQQDTDQCGVLLQNQLLPEQKPDDELFLIQQELNKIRQNPIKNERTLKDLEIKFKKLTIETNYLNNWRLKIIDCQFRLLHAKMALK